MSIYKRGSKYWIGFRFNSIRYQKPSPDNSLASAKAYEAVLRQKLARGDSMEETKKESTTPAFKEFSDQWFEVYVKNNNKDSEIVNKFHTLKARLVPFFNDRPIDKINNLLIESFKAKELKCGLANKTINNHLLVLSKLLRTAEEWGIINQIPKIKLLKVQQQKFDFLTEQESEILLNNSDGLLREMILFVLKTGLRFGELIALEWGDVDFQNKCLTVKKSIYRGKVGNTKSNKIRHIPLLNEVIQMLLVKPSNEGFIFGIDGKPFSPGVYLKWLHRACTKGGLRKIGWHNLRHSFASQLAQKGVSLKVIQELLGHSNIVTTMRYSHLTSSTIKDAIQALNKNFDYNMTTVANPEEEEMFIPTPVGFKISLKTQ